MKRLAVWVKRNSRLLCKYMNCHIIIFSPAHLGTCEKNQMGKRRRTSVLS